MVNYQSVEQGSGSQAFKEDCSVALPWIYIFPMNMLSSFERMVYLHQIFRDLQLAYSMRTIVTWSRLCYDIELHSVWSRVLGHDNNRV